MRILVTGAGGFIGSALIHYLLVNGENFVCGLTHLPMPRAADESSRTKYFQADLRDFGLIESVVKEVKPDLTFHLAAAGVRDPFLPLEEALETNFQGTMNLVRAMFDDEENPLTKKVIICRTPGERTAMNHYAASKAAAWVICKMFARTRGWPVIGGMLYQVYGPGQSKENLIPAAVEAALAGRDFPMTEGSQLRDWVYIDDVVKGLDALSKADLKPGQSVDIGSGRLVSVAETARMVYEIAEGGGRPLIGALPSRPGEEKVQVADAAQTKKLIKWQAVISLQVGLEQLISFGKERI